MSLVVINRVTLVLQCVLLRRMIFIPENIFSPTTIGLRDVIAPSAIQITSRHIALGSKFAAIFCSCVVSAVFERGVVFSYYQYE